MSWLLTHESELPHGLISKDWEGGDGLSVHIPFKLHWEIDLRLIRTP